MIGHQWWWEFRYPQLGVVTANELVLPVGSRCRSEDAFRGRDPQLLDSARRRQARRESAAAQRDQAKNATRVNHLTFNVETAGYYIGQCAEFCGESHAIMRIGGDALQPEASSSDGLQSMGGHAGGRRSCRRRQPQRLADTLTQRATRWMQALPAAARPAAADARAARHAPDAGAGRSSLHRGARQTPRLQPLSEAERGQAAVHDPSLRGVSHDNGTTRRACSVRT